MANPSGAQYEVGSVRLTVVNDGVYYYDAAPPSAWCRRVMWERVAPPMDERYRIPLGLNCLLLRSEGKTVLVESGVWAGSPGTGESASPAEEGTLLDSLAALEVRPEQIDVVVNTHLHADHCGGTRPSSAARGGVARAPRRATRCGRRSPTPPTTSAAPNGTTPPTPTSAPALPTWSATWAPIADSWSWWTGVRDH